MSGINTTPGLVVEREIVSAARCIVEDRCQLFEACRKIAELRWDLPDPDSDLFDVFLAVACETEDLPIGSQRQYWNSESLKRKDAEGAEYEKQVRPAVLEAAQEILARYWFVDQIPNRKE